MKLQTLNKILFYKESIYVGTICENLSSDHKTVKGACETNEFWG